MPASSLRRARWAAAVAAVGLAAGLVAAAATAAPAAAFQTDSIPVPTDPAVSGPQAGTLANGVTWSVDVGQGHPDQGYAIAGGNTQTWTFSEPVAVTFSVAGLNCTGEAMRLPLGSTVVSLGARHSYNAATGVVSGNGAGPAVESTFIAPGLVTTIALEATNIPGCGRGPTAFELALPEPFDCDVSMIFVAQGSPTQLQRLVAGSGSSSFEDVGPATVSYNSIAYHDADDLIYAGDAAGNLLLIDATGAVVNLGQPTPAMGGSNVGAVGPDGRYYVMSGGTARLNVVDLTTLANTPITLSEVGGTADLTFIDGFLWGDGGPNGGLTRIDPSSGAVERFPSPVPDSVRAGASWTYGNGNLGLSDNVSGDVYQIAITDSTSAAPSFTLVSVSPGPTSGQNDGTSCEGLPADLSLSKTSTTPVLPGEPVTWTITVTNDGPGASSGYVVNDTIPAGFTDLSSTTPGCSFSGNDLTCVGGVLPAGESDAITVTGTAPASPGLLSNTAAVTGNEDDPDPSDNRSTARTWVASLSGLCRGTALDALGIRLGSANDPEAPCRTEHDTVVAVTQTSGPWPISPLNSTLRAIAVSGSSTSGPRLAAAESQVASLVLDAPSLKLSIAATGVHSAVTSTLGDTCDSGSVQGRSRIGTLVLNGQTIVVGDAPISIPLPGLGALHLNQQVVAGNTIVQRAVFLDLPGTALDVAVAESKAGVVCDPAPAP